MAESESKPGRVVSLASNVEAGAVPANVLLAMREGSLRGTLTDLLESENYRVALVADLHQAREHAKMSHFDVAVVDTDFSDETRGSEFALLPRVSRNPFLRVLLLCASPPPADICVAVGERLHGFLLKPFDPAWLLHLIHGAARAGIADLEVSKRDDYEAESRAETEDLRERLAALQTKALLLEVAGSLNHELKNLLSVINVSAFILKKRGSELGLDKTMTKHLGIIGDQVGRSQEQILRFSQMLRGEELSGGRPTDINHVIHSLLGVLDHSLSGKNVTVRTDFADDLPPVVLPESALRHALFNLILNARDAMTGSSRLVDEIPGTETPPPDSGTKRGGGTLTIRTRLTTSQTPEVPSEIAIAVEDTGPGVPTEIGDKIFEPFFTTKSQSNATGLGLSISRRLVGSFGGTLVLASSSAGGARFVVTVPVSIPGGAVAKNGSAATPLRAATDKSGRASAAAERAKSAAPGDSASSRNSPQPIPQTLAHAEEKP